MIVLFLIAGISALAAALGSHGLNASLRRGLVDEGSADILIALVATAFRRARWGRLVLVAMVLLALAVYGYGNFVEGDPYRDAMYLFVIAVWVGAAHPRGTNVALAPFYTLAYWLPVWLHPHGPTFNQSVPFVVIVAVASGETVAWLASRLQSVSEEVRRYDQRRFAALDAESSDGTMVMDRAGTLSYVSASVGPLFGYRPTDLQGRQMTEIIDRSVDPADTAVAESSLQRALASPTGQEIFRTRIHHLDGSWRHVEFKIRNLVDDEIVGAVLIDFWDITDRMQARADLEASEESFRLLFQLSPLPTLVFDPVSLTCLRANDAACAHYGYTRPEFAAMTILHLLPEPDPKSLYEIDDPPPGGYLRAGLWQHQTRDGRLIDVDVAVNVTQLDGVDACMVLVVDVTEQRHLEDQLRQQVLHDGLTGLANRALLQDRLERALAATARQAQSVAVLYCDLDGFKTVNDTLGHAAGDRVLRQVASRLTGIVRPGDTVARFGADEFAIVAELINDPKGAQTLAERIVAAVAQPIDLDGKRVHLSVSIGIAFGTAGIGADELCRSADAAKGEAKASGRNCYRVFEAATRARALRALELTGDLRPALDRGEFRLQYQPVVDLATGRLQGFEALVRWSHPTQGMIPPLDFIPLAEQSGLIVPLGRWILETACEQAANWPDTPDLAPTIAVNLSVHQLRSVTIVDDLATALALSGLDPGRLVLEVTESVLMADTQATVALIERLKALGVRLAIDDFGTGYSSLSYLNQFRFDILKIDKSFVDVLQDLQDQRSAFIRTIVALGHTLGMQIITEGIETAEQYRILAALGSDAGQGYLMSRPLDPADALAFMNRPAGNYTILTVPEQSGS
jgi:diguanylate cyclase (GGDEF)-like protein/PAS domain S-box-containing protein